MSLFVPRRRPSAERLDDPALPADEMRRSLEDLSLVHRRWGGSRALAAALLERLDGARGRTVRILDVGGGSGDVARSLESRLREAGRDAAVLAVDVQWRHLAAGRAISGGARLRAAAADAFRLPFADRSVELAVSTLFFHHFSPDGNAAILRELSRVARLGFAVLDLRRAWIPMGFVALAGRAVFRARISVEDGVASVRQAYTPREAEAIARRVAPDAAARRVFPYRFLLEGGRA